MIPPREDAMLPAGLLLLGAVLLACAALCLDAAFEHLAALGAICGGSAPHCGWRLASAAFLAAGIAAAGAGGRPLRAAGVACKVRP